MVTMRGLGAPKPPTISSGLVCPRYRRQNVLRQFRDPGVPRVEINDGLAYG